MADEKAPDTRIQGLESKIKELEARVKKAKAENAKLKAEIGELKAQAKKDTTIIASLSSEVARVTVAAERLKKLYAHDGPHDPVSKYD